MNKGNYNYINEITYYFEINDNIKTLSSPPMFHISSDTIMVN